MRTASGFLTRAISIAAIAITLFVWGVTIGNLVMPTQREIVMLAGLRMILALAAFAAALALARRRRGWAFAAAAIALYHGGGILSYSIPVHAAPADKPRLKILYANIDRPSLAWDGFRKVAEEFDPDILIADEVDEVWKPHMEWAEAKYPYRVATWDGYGMAMYSRVPITDSAILTEPGRFGKTIPAKLLWNGKAFRIYATHVNSPVDDAGFMKQSRQFDTIARAIESHPEATFVVGDMNACETRSEFRRLMAACRLRDSRGGFGWEPSWPWGWPILTIPLDHILVPERWRVVERHLGPYYGSDHRPVLLTVVQED